MNYCNSSATLGAVLLKNIVVGKANMGNWAAAVNTYQSITKLCVPSINTKICNNISLKIQKMCHKERCDHGELKENWFQISLLPHPR